jgi:endonuclease/exonuclease/phosphatase family metal-dependent hydrolase
VTWVELADRHADRLVLVINTHLDHVGEQARVRGAQLILDLVKQWPVETPMIILGDFNASPYRPSAQCSSTSRTFGVFAEAGFMDAYRSATGVWPPPATFHNYQGERYVPDQYGTWYIDWPLTRNLCVLAAEIVRHRPEDLPLSDHYPVYVEVGYTDGA